MRLQPSSAVFRDIWERGDATILREVQTVVVATGFSATSAGVAPPAGRRWLVMQVGLSCEFAAAPAAGDIGDTSVQILTGVDSLPLAGMTIDDTLGQFLRERGLPAFLVLDENDIFLVRGNAITAAVSVNATAFLSGFEYVPIA